MAERREYQPPRLNRRVRLRNPDEQPPTRTDQFGREISPPDWGIDVWAERRDRAPATINEEGVPVHQGSTVWTIRYRDNVAANVQVIPLLDDGSLSSMVFESEGPAVERGRRGAGASHLQLFTKLRQ